MKRNRTLPLALVTFAALTFASNAAWANHHWGNNNGMGNQGYSQLTQEQQATVQKLHNDYYAQTSALRQQLQSKRYEYNALLTAQKPDSGKIEAVAQEMEGLRQKLDQQRVKFDIALAEAGVPRGAGMGYGGCRGSAERSYGHEPLVKVRSFFPSAARCRSFHWRPAAVESLPAPQARQCSLRRKRGSGGVQCAPGPGYRGRA